MPAKNHLSKEQKEKLLKEMRENENAQIRERVLILLLMNEGKTYQEIANFLEISYPTVAYWAVHGDPDIATAKAVKQLCFAQLPLHP
jgi:DNA-directed RNA polymerase specialized sigma24 family protein